MAKSKAQTDMEQVVTITLDRGSWESVYCGLKDLADRIEKDPDEMWDGSETKQGFVQVNRQIAERIETQYLSGLKS